MRKKGKGSPVTLGERRRYDTLREAGWSPEASAEAIHRSKSWAYSYEGEKNAHLRRQAHPVPRENLADAVELVLAIKEDPDDQERAFEIFDKFGAAVVPDMAELVVYMARVQAGATQSNLRGMLDGEDDLVTALLAEPMTWQDMLTIIPRNFTESREGKRRKGDNWLPDRAEAWVTELESRYPELAELRAEVIEGLADSDDPYGYLLGKRDEIRAGEPA